MENPKTLSETIQRTVREELCMELTFIRADTAEAIADRVCRKIQDTLDDYDSLEEAEQAFINASKKMGW